jgi:5-methylthioadenosine/S-adenosylhomocysteine deaminase
MALARALQDTGLAGIVAPTLQDLSGPGVPLLDAALEETATIDDDAGLRGVGIGAAVGPHATDTVSADLWRRAATVAAERGLPIHAHVAQFVGEYHKCVAEQGCSPVAWLSRLGVLGPEVPSMALVHGLFVSRADLALLDPARHVPVFCPNSHLRFAFPARVEVVVSPVSFVIQKRERWGEGVERG